MKKAIKPIYFSLLTLFTAMFLTNVKAITIDLKEYEKKPAAILREFLKIMNTTNMQICHLNGSEYRSNTSYITFNPQIKIVLPDSSNQQYIVNCMFLEGYSVDGKLEKPNNIESLYHSLKLITDSLMLPIEIQWTYETIRIIITPSFNNEKFFYQIILNIDPTESHRIRRSTLTSTLRPTTINKIHPLSSDEETSKNENLQHIDSESENDSSNNYQPYCSPAQLRFIRVSPSFNENDLDQQDSNSDTASNPELAKLFENYIEYVSHEHDEKLKRVGRPNRQMGSTNLYEQNLIRLLKESDDKTHQQSQENAKFIAYLDDSQVMYHEGFDDTGTSYDAYNNDTPEQSDSEDEIYRDW